MGAPSEITAEPLTPQALEDRFRLLCVDPRFSDLPGKIELDPWGQLLMSPASNFHGLLQMRLGQRLAALGGQSLVEASVLTAMGLFVADVAWLSADFLRGHGTETPYRRAPPICIEIASPSNSLKALHEKTAAYIDAGAIEAWVVYTESRRFQYFCASGEVSKSSFEIDLEDLFEV